MDLLKELKPYMKHIEAYKNMQGNPSDPETIKALVDIWVRLQKKHMMEIHNRLNVRINDCMSCTSEMMKTITNFYDKYKRDEDHYKNHATLEFKGVIKHRGPESTYKGEDLEWNDYRKFCKSLDINTKGKKRSELEVEVNNIINNK